MRIENGNALVGIVERARFYIRSSEWTTIGNIESPFVHGCFDFLRRRGAAANHILRSNDRNLPGVADNAFKLDVVVEGAVEEDDAR